MGIRNVKTGKTKALSKTRIAIDPNVTSVIADLKRLADRKTRDGMVRFAIPNDRAFGVPVGKIRELGKRLGRNHVLASQMWKTGWYEARMLTAFVAEPAKLTPALMDRWCREFDNWAICDTFCIHLFDRSPHAFDKVRQWCNAKDEFVRRASFALLASLAIHAKKIGDEPFRACLPLIEPAANDERNFVKKGVSWALRSIGRRRMGLRDEVMELATRLSKSENAAARWVGKDALRDIRRG